MQTRTLFKNTQMEMSQIIFAGHHCVKFLVTTIIHGSINYLTKSISKPNAERFLILLQPQDLNMYMLPFIRLLNVNGKISFRFF